MLRLIEKLSLINGISGRENAVRDFIINEVKSYATSIETDALGNLIVFKKGKQTPKNKVMLDAHMDEVGMIITHINADGTLKFECVGGIDKRVMLGRAVNVGENNIHGVIGVKAVHMVSADERLNMPKEMYIDIGARDKEDAEKYVNLGDYACFNSEFVEFGDGFIKGKALDDRAGCAILIEIIKSDLPYDLYFNFSTGEEVGLGFASVAAYKIKPDYSIVVETTTAADLADVPEDKYVCKLKNGGAISFMDKRTIYPKELFDRAFNIAKINNLPVQPKSAVTGGNNAGVIHKVAGGVRTLAVSLPCRYLHSPSCVLHEKDIESMTKLVALLATEFAND